MLDWAYLFNDASVTPNILVTENQMSRPLCTKHTCFFPSHVCNSLRVHNFIPDQQITLNYINYTNVTFYFHELAKRSLVCVTFPLQYYFVTSPLVSVKQVTFCANVICID